jgi:tRNA(Ile)-lysidine synthase
LEPGSMLLTAHHQADQAETVLMRLLSGAGPRGQGAMRALTHICLPWQTNQQETGLPWQTNQQETGLPWQTGLSDGPESAGLLIGRPFLGAPKSALQEYATAHSLHWLEDPSNQNSALRRNQVRQWMPALRARFPDTDAVLARHAQLAQADSELLNEFALQALARCLSADATVLVIEPLRKEPPALQSWIIRAWLQKLGCFQSQLVPACLALAQSERDQGEARVRRENWVCIPTVPPRDTVYVRRFNGLLYFELCKESTSTQAMASISWDGNAPIRFGELELSIVHNDGNNLLWQNDYAKNHSAMHWHIAQRSGGERIILPGRTHSHAVKDVLQQLKLPPWQRARAVIIRFADSLEVACVPGACASARFVHWLHAHQLRLEYRKHPYKF